MFFTRNRLAWIIGGTVAAIGVTFAMKKLGLIKKIQAKSQNTLDRVLFFGRSGTDATSVEENQYLISYMLLSARHSVDVCVGGEGVRGAGVRAALARAAGRDGVRVRLLLWECAAYGDVVALAASRVEVKVINGGGLAHSFVLVDAGRPHAAALLGAAPTAADVADHLVLASDPALIRSLKMEFDRIWSTMHYGGDDIDAEYNFL